jgi:sugar/nucleoside kinase (ribokinase family)
MRYFIKLRIPIEMGNVAVKDPQFGSKMQQMLKEMKAETAYFTVVDGQRGGYIIVDIDDASKIPAIVEPLFYWLKADVEFFPVMLPEDLAKAGSAIEAASKKWG